MCGLWMLTALFWQGQAKDVVAAPADLPELQSVLLRSVAGTRAPGASWGVQVVSLKTGAVWFETNATRLFVPASNSKLFTVALALDRFGADHRFQTVLRASAKPGPDGALAGDLRGAAAQASFAAQPAPALVAGKGHTDTSTVVVLLLLFLLFLLVTPPAHVTATATATAIAP
jgi:hypothetical protein